MEFLLQCLKKQFFHLLLKCHAKLRFFAQRRHMYISEPKSPHPIHLFIRPTYFVVQHLPPASRSYISPVYKFHQERKKGWVDYIHVSSKTYLKQFGSSGFCKI